MGALAHYLEAEGIPTTQISLIREHTEIIRPPRALWVPFDLGRPLGTPDAPVFQRRVLLAALELLEEANGPLLQDFAEEAPEDGCEAESGEEVVSACPVSFAPPLGDATDDEALVVALKREVAALQPWYDLGRKRRGRSTVGYFGPDEASTLLSCFILGKMTEAPMHDFDLTTALRLAASDLRAFYYEALLTRPGVGGPPAASAFSQWFWRETVAGRLLRAVKERCRKEEDGALRMTGEMLLVPMDQT